MKNIHLTEQDIHDLANEKTFEKGEELYECGAISATSLKGNTIYGKCDGSEFMPYDIEIDLSDDEIDPYCTCPFDWGGICKHQVALLLTFLYEPEKFIELEDPTTLLEQLDREKLILLISDLIKDHPNIQFWLQKYLKKKPDA